MIGELGGLCRFTFKVVGHRLPEACVTNIMGHEVDELW